MKLYYSPTSPFVRKCLISAHELGLAGKLQLIAVAPTPIKRESALVSRNPLGKIPTLETDEGDVLFDSRVICEYLNALGGGRLLPATGEQRWTVLTDQAVGDGLMDAAVLVRYETALRPKELNWKEWISGQHEKMAAAVSELDLRATGFAQRLDLGTIAAACALGYLDFRYASIDWRAQAPRAAAWFKTFAQRDSVQATLPPAA